MSQRILIGILLLFIASSFLTLPRNPLLNDDASAYALAAKNAIVHNYWLAQFITPDDPSSFLDKPPLGIWLLAWLPKLVGLNELTIHIPNILYYCLLLALIYFALAKLSSKKIALASILIAATSLVLIIYARAPKLDVLLTLFVTAANLSLFSFLKREKIVYLYLFAFFLALGFLVKSSFGILIPGLTFVFLLIFNARARQKLFSSPIPHTPYLALLFGGLIFIILYVQSFALGDQWLPYLKSITFQSKYNTGYLGLGLNYSIIGFLLITIFPWSPLALTTLLKNRRINSAVSKPGILFAGVKLNLNTFCLDWFWSNFLFLFLFYRQTDLRTFTVFVPPLAILAAIRLISLNWKPRRLDLDELGRVVAGFRTELFWNIFFLVIFVVGLAVMLINPHNKEGFDMSAAILPVGFFAFSLLLLTFFYLKPSSSTFAFYFAFVALSYVILFYNTKPLADAFNPDLKWPGIIKQAKNEGEKFYIYRPPDRNLFYSPDLQYVDFLAGPADKYFWDGKALRQALNRGKAIVLSDTQSWGKLGLKGRVVARDNYSLLVAP